MVAHRSVRLSPGMGVSRWVPPPITTSTTSATTDMKSPLIGERGLPGGTRRVHRDGASVMGQAGANELLIKPAGEHQDRCRCRGDESFIRHAEAARSRASQPQAAARSCQLYVRVASPESYLTAERTRSYFRRHGGGRQGQGPNAGASGSAERTREAQEAGCASPVWPRSRPRTKNGLPGRGGQPWEPTRQPGRVAHRPQTTRRIPSRQPRRPPPRSWCGAAETYDGAALC